MRAFVLFAATLALASLSQQALAQAQPQSMSQGYWSTPTVKGYGRVHYLAEGAFQPDRNGRYKIVLGLTQAARSPSDVNPSLDEVARTINMYTAAGVPIDHLQVAAVAYGPATSALLDNAHYRAQFGINNPNAALLAQLKQLGIYVSVCAQAMGERHYDLSWVDRNASISLSAITTITVLQQNGFALMPE